MYLTPASRGAAGFSLREMFVVMVLLAVVTAVLTGDFGGSSRKRAMAACVGNLQKISLALSIYQNDNNGAFPAVAGAANSAPPLSLLVPKSTTMTEIFTCPGSEDKPLPEGESFASRKISYAYYMGRTKTDGTGEIIVSDAQVDVAPKDVGQQVFSADGHGPGSNHGKDGGNLLTCGGEVIASGPKAARELRYPPTVHLLNP
jgi:type II secretory pathway pseudopilin PulG